MGQAWYDDDDKNEDNDDGRMILDFQKWIEK